MEKEYQNIEALETNIFKVSDRLQQVKIIAEFILNHLNATRINNSKSSIEIWDEYEKLKEKCLFIPEIPRNTFNIYLSRASSDQESKINCPGTAQGYYLEKLVDTLEKLESSSDSNNSGVNKSSFKGNFQEKNLYPILKNWLYEKDFDRLADISTLKSNGKWGNPDLVGFRIDDIFGKFEIEITTIELKLTDENWEQWIMEAVSHTRFSNRSYFGFMYPENLLNKLDSTEIKLYAEHFGIGILIIEIEGQEFLKIKERKDININFEKLRIIEYFQAPYSHVNIKFRKKFINALDIKDIGGLYAFGEKLN